MKHLFVTNDFPPKTGGIESYLRVLCQGFDPDDVTVIAPRRIGWDEVDSRLPYRVVRLPGAYLRGSARVRRGIVEVARETGADVVHFLHALPLGRLARGIRKRTRLPVTVFVHGSEVFVPGRVPLVRRSLRRVFATADRVIAVSEYTRGGVDRLAKGRADVDVLHPAVDVDRFSLAVSGGRIRARYGLGGRFTAVFVGRLVKRKGAEALIRAIAHVPETCALVVGSGPEEASLRRLVADLELEDRAFFAGSVSDAELPRHYAAGDVFCMPCTDRYGGIDTEGFGIVCLEAAACGLPAVVGACGGTVEAVKDGETGIVLEDAEPETVAEVLASLRANGARRAQMGAAGREWAERFAPERQARRLERICGDLEGRTATG